MSEESPGESGESEDSTAEEAHLADMPDGCGCVEVWEVLSERRVASETASEQVDST